MPKKPDKVFIIGDIHGKVQDYYRILSTKTHFTDEEVRSIQIGDFGFSSSYMERHKLFRKNPNLKTDHHLFFGGNHDDYDNLPDFHIGDYGKVPFLPQSYFVRGAKSIDEHARTAGHDWWREEELNWKQAKKCVEDFRGRKPKIILTHDAPDSVCRKMFDGKRINSTTGKLLQNLLDIHRPEFWIFGHWHEDKVDTIKGTTFICLDELSVFEFDKDKTLDENIENYL